MTVCSLYDFLGGKMGAELGLNEQLSLNENSVIIYSTTCQYNFPEVCRTTDTQAYFFNNLKHITFL